jgi:hypothetical protein
VVGSALAARCRGRATCGRATTWSSSSSSSVSTCRSLRRARPLTEVPGQVPVRLAHQDADRPGDPDQVGQEEQPQQRTSHAFERRMLAPIPA